MKLDLKDIVDDGTTITTVRHIIHSDFDGNQFEDRCLQFFGEEDDECWEWNKNYEKRCQKKI